ncbi:hypothetical protein AVEN_240282-1 [Araneus ventricosus]|uniref:DUF4371 domain-containing protein n=1 Tax=Araneus ventricosus TaxID=182803 RepID=A0A4Y2U2B9_ARAVE|nr:hypothetical protein AVEN_240282-1 [Araneus ventricosus]
MKQHLDRCVESASHSSLSHRIQGELISALAKKVRKEIINFVKKAKYFTILLDCTPDVSHQLSVILRYVNVDESESLWERFGTLYNYVTKSLYAWDVLKRHVKDLPKPLSETMDESDKCEIGEYKLSAPQFLLALMHWNITRHGEDKSRNQSIGDNLIR